MVQQSIYLASPAGLSDCWVPVLSRFGLWRHEPFVEQRFEQMDHNRRGPARGGANLTKQNPTFKHEGRGCISLTILATGATNERLSCTLPQTLWTLYEARFRKSYAATTTWYDRSTVGIVVELFEVELGDCSSRWRLQSSMCYLSKVRRPAKHGTFRREQRWLASKRLCRYREANSMITASTPSMNYFSCEIGPSDIFSGTN